MFHSGYANCKINILHERALVIFYNDYELSFEELLEKDKSLWIHYQNIHRLLTEIYNALNNQSGNKFSQFFARLNNDIGLHSK